ncbi:DUF2789 domain-containing protein [Polaromonas sp. P1(28)-13]|nr:DUF2789 domain-containing protein [Polaromonas sp. P1-6]UUZ68032.1 DUF2789 domain-containing protein [Polaromonas sp. P2-4]UUZ75811.1 DUF2789 domain-containing protein [Polaromonas sp. P1(28)-13]
MDTSHHDLSNLFLQLGLPGEPQAIDAFLADHRLHAGTALPEAPFWSRAQAEFLREALADDSDWAEAADELAMLLSQNR